VAIGDRLRFVTSADGQVVPIGVSPGTSEVGRNTGSLLSELGQGQGKSRDLVPYDRMTGIRNTLANIRIPAALRTAGLVPGLGILATGGLIANALLQDDSIEVAERNFGWVARALDPTTITTQDNETVRSATSQHSKTGNWIVYPTIRSVDGKLVKLDDALAKRRAEELGDFITFDDLEEAEEFSKNLSNKIGEKRRMANRQNRGLL
jgi:hypothetical protein